MKNFTKKILHRIFRIAITIKGFDGFLEVIGGLLLLYFSSDSISHFVEFIFRHELLHDPDDPLANYMIDFSRSLSISTKYFGAVYMLAHGTVKIALMLGLWSDSLRVYPPSGLVLVLMISYQIFRLSHHFSDVLFFLTLADIAIAVLLLFEYQRLKKLEVTKSLKETSGSI